MTKDEIISSLIEQLKAANEKIARQSVHIADITSQLKEALARLESIEQSFKAKDDSPMRMSGKGPHLGLMITEGKITNYDVWERGSNKGMSNFRGVFALCPPDMTLKPGQSYSLAWRLFTHNGTDFDEQLIKRGGTVVKSEKYVYAVGETARVDFVTDVCP